MKRPLLLPLVPLYAAGVAWKSRGFAQHPARAKRLMEPVVSVGSLSAGGAGKTPFVIALGEAIRRAGYGMDVLTRGHGRTSAETLRVNAHGNAAEFGDEPLLIARRLACPVYVGRERFPAGEMAERERRHLRADKSLLLHLLDDGFQHRQLARTVDIALLTLEDAHDTLLPAGNLREPLRALRRADVIVLRGEEEAALRPVVERIFAGQKQPHIWIIDRRFAFTEGAPTTRPLAFCGIARPDGFRVSLAQAGVQTSVFVPLKDHATYDDALVSKLIQQAKAAQADGFVTTAKDAVKLTQTMRQALAQVGPLAVGDILVQLRDEAQCVAETIAIIETWWKQVPR
jgi:tetraacyldisaccharide 4'-kinase